MNNSERLYGVTAILLADGWHAVGNVNLIYVDSRDWFAATENLGSDDEPNWFTLSGPLQNILAVRKHIDG